MNLINKIGRLFNSEKTTNLFNQSFFELVGSTGTSYDTKGKTYVESGYNVNTMIYSIVQQQARKTAMIPFYIKDVDDEQKARNYKIEVKKFQTPQGRITLRNLEKKAFNGIEDNYPMPIENPNMFQSWPEFISLYKTFLKLNGNVYIYQLAPENGVNAGAPSAIYLLPSHLMNIVLKSGANMMLDENPIDFYRLIEGNTFVDFPEDSIIHIKYANPNFSLNGEHLYGQSPLRSALKNIESSNEAMAQNVKTLKNAGVYGFIHGKSQPITPDQAQELKSRLQEMDNNPERLGRLAGVSAEIGFQRLSLTTDELQPFAFLDYDQKQICNVLGWKDVLLNNSDNNNWDSVKEFKKSVVMDDIMPDLELLESAFNEILLPKYKAYAGRTLYFDASTLPEMQLDMASLTVWLSRALADGVVNRNEYRDALNYPTVEDEDFDTFTVSSGIKSLEDALEAMPEPDPNNLMIEDEDEDEDEEKKHFIYK